MSLISTLIQAVGAFLSAVSFAQVVRAVFSLSALAGFVMFFRPLLVGIARALVLTVRPRRARDHAKLAAIASRG
ncbi:MAG: hypothetical protein ACJ8LG_15920 [Massilia sp.]